MSIKVSLYGEYLLCRKRPCAEYPDNWNEYYKKWKLGEITAIKCMEILNLKRSTFYKLVKIYEKEIYKNIEN